MKTILSLACIVSFIFCGPSALPQGASAEPDNYIVVIGAFSIEENANHFLSSALEKKLKAKVELNKIRNLYYVYILETGDKTAAIAEAQRLQTEGPYSDTWVFNGSLGERVVISEPVPAPVVVLVEPVVESPKPPPVDLAKERDEKIKKAVNSKQMELKKGARETLDYIFFYRDAAILRPESQHEVDRLVRLLNENPDEEIRIHGHTNGDEPGKIIKLKDPNGDFFSLGNSVEDYGSAKDLSEMRANVIRSYLVKNGISEKRMSIKAWGGKKPLYSIDSDKAEANVRVEIEVLN